MKTIIKRILFAIAILAVLIAVGISLFVGYAPQFGQAPEKNYGAAIQSSPNYKNDRFINLTETTMDMSVGNVVKITKELINAKNTVPQEPLPVQFGEGREPVSDTATYITWYGHSALLLEMEGKRILLDPMFGAYSSPVSFFGKRFAYQSPIDINAFTNIDAVMLSHDHYDHLDYGSILQLKDQVSHFYVPLGVGSHLQYWGVEPAKITELDWWETAEADGFSYTATPARHFSGRGILDRDKTLWASWIVKGKYSNIYFSGDGGYGTHFKDIGERYGPFDFTLMECGQYNEKWANIHMMPEQTLQASIDLRGKAMMPIHWGAFALAVHPWREPAERLMKAAAQAGVTVAFPVIGQRFSIHAALPDIKWWEENVMEKQPNFAPE